MSKSPVISHLQRPEGRIAWSLHGTSGPLVVGMPGMGDLRENWDGFAEALAHRGYRVAVMDLRGHGRSDATFQDVSRETIGADALALADSLSPEEPVVFVGNSYTGASAVWLATEKPARVQALVLIAPFARGVEPTFFQKAALKVGLLRPWGPAVWASYYGSLFPVHPPEDLDARKKAVRENLRETGRLESLRSMGSTTAASCESRLDQVRSPTLILFGSRDPDFPDPAAEGTLIASRTGGTYQSIPEAGHYPHAEDPDGIAGRVDAFVRQGEPLAEIQP